MRAAVLVVAGFLVAVGLLVGCQTTQRDAREQANQRWNLARAEVKAKLAADQLELGQVTSAAAALAEARHLAPDETKFVPLQARIWLADGQTARAAQLLETTHLDGADQAEVEYLLGVVRQAQQRWPEALVAFRRAADLAESDSTFVVGAAQAHLQLGEAELALDLLQRFAQRFGWTDDVLAAAAECHEQLGDWPAAAAAWERVVGTAGSDPELRQRWAVALYRAQRFDDAIAALQAALQGGDPEPSVRNPMGTDALSAKLRLMLAECFLATGKHSAAREQVQAVLRQFPDSAPGNRLLAQILAAKGDYVAALGAARRALVGGDNDVATLELAAALAHRAGEVAAVAELAQRLLEIDPQNAVARCVLNRQSD